MKLSYLFTLLAIVNGELSNNYAVIVSSSGGYFNYRLQANGCHLYNNLIQNGFSESNIIHFNVDDAVKSQTNPFVG